MGGSRMTRIMPPKKNIGYEAKPTVKTLRCPKCEAYTQHQVSYWENGKQRGCKCFTCGTITGRFVNAKS